MTYELTSQDSFFVSGIAVRTTNQNDRAMKDIGDLWAKFTSENIAAKISDKYSDDIYCVYTDYETDHSGWYTAVLGCRVTDVGNDGTFIALIPSGNYQLYKPEGKLPDAIGETWMKIWEDSAGRSYIADYDVYKKGSEDKVEIYVGTE